MSTDNSKRDAEVDHVEYGTVEHADPGSASDDTWDTVEADSATVAFDWGFEEPPAVVIEPTEETSVGLHRAINVSATGFETRWMVYGTESTAVDGHWAAFGEAGQSRGHEPSASEIHVRPGGPWPTETQQLNINSLHDYEQLERTLERIERKGNGRVTVESAGESNEGRDLYLATVGNGDTDVFLFAEQHADEATGCEALLNLLEELAAGGQWSDLLEELTLHVMPRANPDGVEYGELRHRFNVDPDAPARDESAGIYTDYDGAGVGWDVNRYHWFDWTESELYQNYPEEYPENPVPEAQILVDTIEAIDPLWVADFHNQYHYVSDEGENITGSIYWPTASGADPDAQDLSKQLCRGIYDDVDSQGNTTLTQFPGGDTRGIARNSYGERGIGCVLIEMRGQTDEFGQKSGGQLIRTAYEMAVSMLERTADESVFDVDPAAVEEIPERGERHQRTFHPSEELAAELEESETELDDDHFECTC
ncbi:M14 family zinc carboxypeptidase [Halostagnicola sp. A-GB9-2]|uniref:M14 family zinc carboxypeptidase n=1 Tax=Halostagnicola sp. A-GB9-2 TaxID=3048066 RepID=UPI0024BFB939|nr:M14 family zinc carboxypeptidase [Halostagnicola sp. A-GB9-2]MDJ1434161.1 M14 family zinc carboxypeptidase [Halostagnicola sp. A-GB9-2]